MVETNILYKQQARTISITPLKILITNNIKKLLLQLKNTIHGKILQFYFININNGYVKHDTQSKFLRNYKFTRYKIIFLRVHINNLYFMR